MEDLPVNSGPSVVSSMGFGGSAPFPQMPVMSNFQPLSNLGVIQSGPFQTPPTTMHPSFSTGIMGVHSPVPPIVEDGKIWSKLSEQEQNKL
ncbi:hypothetical protein HK096_008999, partial [Nowakowskiella sp. JEL0078]